MKETVLNAGRILRDYYISQYGSNITDANINRLCSVATDLLPGEKYGQMRSILSLCQRYHAFKKYTEGNLDWTARAKSVLYIMQNDAMLAKNFALCAVVLVVMICDGKEEGEKHAMAILSPGGTEPTQPTANPQPVQTQPVQTQPTQIPTEPKANNSQTQSAHKQSNPSDFEIADGVLIKYKGEGDYVVIPEGITTIGKYALSPCEWIKRVVIPFGVKVIDECAFYKCKNLNNIVIPEGVTTIKKAAFDYCISLTSIHIPASVTRIEEYAFSSCKELSILTVSQGNKVYHSSGNCIIETAKKTVMFGCNNSVIPSDGSVTTIGKEAFYDCSGLTSISIPKSVTRIENSAFWGCSGLESFIIPDSVEHIGRWAFCKCVGIKSISIPDSITWIDDGAFAECRGLTKVVIPNSVTSIGKHAFMSCESLTNIQIPKSVTRIDDEAFSYCRKLTDVLIHDGITMGKDVFFACPALKV